MVPAWAPRPGHPPPRPALPAVTALRKHGARRCHLLPQPWWGGASTQPAALRPPPSPSLCLHPPFPTWAPPSSTLTTEDVGTQIPCRLNLDSVLTRPQCLEVSFRLQPRSFHSQPSLQTLPPSTTPRLLPTFPAASSPGSVLVHRFWGEDSTGRGLPMPSRRWRGPLLLQPAGHAMGLLDREGPPQALWLVMPQAHSTQRELGASVLEERRQETARLL